MSLRPFFLRLQAFVACLLLASQFAPLGNSAETVRIDTGLAAKISRVTFSADGQTLAVAAEDKTLKVFNVGMRQELTTVRGAYGPLTLSRDGRLLAYAILDPAEMGPAEVKIVSTADGKLLSSIGKLPTRVQALSFSPDGKSLALGLTANVDHVFRSRATLYQVATGKEISQFGSRACADNIPGLIAIYGTALAFSPDGNTLAVGGNVGGDARGDMLFWDVATARQTASGATQHANSPHALAFSPDGKTVFASGDRPVLWDVASGKDVWVKSQGQYGTFALAFDSAGMFVLESGHDGIYKYSADSGKDLATKNRKLGVTAFSPDGKRLAVVEKSEVVIHETAGLFGE